MISTKYLLYPRWLVMWITYVFSRWETSTAHWILSPHVDDVQFLVGVVLFYGDPISMHFRMITKHINPLLGRSLWRMKDPYQCTVSQTCGYHWWVIISISRGATVEFVPSISQLCFAQQLFCHEKVADSSHAMSRSSWKWIRGHVDRSCSSIFPLLVVV